ncbi:BadF/BadG/BcrA/BcrD ATPase family protein [Shewanella indica]|uniref:BadF/BadG/BcrA/BcrD ATPase family protein n=1 Tax=Shewanella indica TaxID=768528 RepID=UPI0030042F6F
MKGMTRLAVGHTSLCEAHVSQSLGAHVPECWDNKPLNKPYWVGIDAGGSHCRALLKDDAGQVLGRGIAGPANPVNGVNQSQTAIMTAIDKALNAANLEREYHNLIVGAGLAGLHLPKMQRIMAQWQHPFAAWHITTDLHVAALGAHQCSDGGVIVLGTGFSSLANVNGQQILIGGHGFPINATCSGAWFGLEAVKAVLLDADGIGPRTGLTAKLLLGTTAIGLAEQLIHANATDFAKFAPRVFEQATLGDAVSLALIEQGAAFINGVILRLLAAGVERVALVGGIAPFMQTWLDPELSVRIHAPMASPEEGGIFFARQCNDCNLNIQER